MSTHEYYRSSTEHILAELERIDLLVQMQVARARASLHEHDEFRGLHITEEEVDRLLKKPVGLPRWAYESNPFTPAAVHRAMQSLSAQIADRKRESERQGVRLRLDQLARLFRLTPFDVDCLLICLAPEMDLCYERLYAYLQDDVTKRHPTVDLVLNLLSLDYGAKLSARRRFAADSALIRHDLVTIVLDKPESKAPLLSRSLAVDERIIHYLLEEDQLDACLKPFVRQRRSSITWRQLWLPQGTKNRLQGLLLRSRQADAGQRSPDEPHHPVVYFHGPPGVGKRAVGEALCHEFEIDLIVVDVRRLLHGDVLLESVLARLFREARLREAAIYFDHFDETLKEGDRLWQCRDALIAELVRHPGLTFLGGCTAWEPPGVFGARMFAQVEIPLPTFECRRRLWETSLNGQGTSDLDLARIANKFRLNAGQIRSAAITARNAARWRDVQNSGVTDEDLHTACRAHSNQRLGQLAQRITPHYGWDDIVLPDEQIDQLREIVSYVNHRHVVYDQWGFAGILALGKGLNALFAGGSGTGKTMAAEVMARELRLDMYKIDVSLVVSKYIGETEKNLSRIFQEAADSNAILLFDEADALFGKRSEVRDAHDRYANIEVAYLLQQMEQYEGIVILATNLRNNLDAAFVRRMHVAIEFPFPDELSRCRIWERLFPSRAPLDASVDCALLARQFKLAGGNIKNIALHAAFLAAEDGKPIGMGHIIPATKREFRKLGRLCDEEELSGLISK